MNRRGFLQMLASLGAGVVFPVNMSSASTSQVNAAWRAANLDPTVFAVGEAGTLGIGDYESVATRAQLYRLASRWSSRKELVDLIDSNWQLENIAESAFTDFQETGSVRALAAAGVPFPSWAEWLMAASADDLASLEGQLRHWLEGVPDLSNEYEWLPVMNEATPESRAYSFFMRLDEDLVDALGVVIVEGEHPGSSYFATELRGDVAVANAYAKAKGIPIRFAAEMALASTHALGRTA